MLFIGNYHLKAASSENFPLELKGFILLFINKNSEIHCISHFGFVLICFFLAKKLEVKSLFILNSCPILISIFSNLYFLLSPCILLFYVSFNLPQLLWNKMAYK